MEEGAVLGKEGSEECRAQPGHGAGLGQPALGRSRCCQPAAHFHFNCLFPRGRAHQVISRFAYSDIRKGITIG